MRRTFTTSLVALFPGGKMRYKLATSRVSRRRFMGSIGGALASLAATGKSATAATVPADSAAFLMNFLSTAGTSATIGGSYILESPVVIPHNIRYLELKTGSKLSVRGNSSALVRRGTIILKEHLPGPITAGELTFSVARGSAYSVGDYLLLSGVNIVPGSLDKYGYIRRVTAIGATAIQIDSPIPRTIDLMPRTSKVLLAPSLKITGAGEVCNLDPSVGRSPLIDAMAVDNFQVLGVDVHHNGTSGLNVAHCLNGLIDCRVHDLLDDGVTYFGYGVNVSGATRGLVVRGTMSRVRHAVTTNPGPILPSIGPVGEPEDCMFAPAAIDCTDKSIDTHRVGWNTTVVPNVVRGRGGVQIRADNTRVVGGSITGSTGPGIFVSASVTVPSQIRDVYIVDLKSSGRAILSEGPSNSQNLKIRNCFGPNIVLSNNCSVIGGSISAGSPVGISFLGSNNSVTDIQLGASVTTPYIEGQSSSNNLFTTAPPLDIEPLPAPVCTQLPSIAGIPKVATQISSSYGVWNLPDLKLTWTWTRNGTPIPGASERGYPRYDIVAADLACRLGVEVRAYKVGFLAGTATASATDAVSPADALVPTVLPYLSGARTVGSYITVNKGTWNPGAQGLVVAWLVDGSVVPGLTTNTYRVATADKGRTISARITASRTGWLNGVYSTVPVTME
jgi:hypothetical protein